MNKLISHLLVFGAAALAHFSLQAEVAAVGDDIQCVSGTAFSEAACPAGYTKSVNVNDIYGKGCWSGAKGLCWNNITHTPRVVGTAPACRASGADCKQGETWIGIFGKSGNLCSADTRFASFNNKHTLCYQTRQ